MMHFWKRIDTNARKLLSFLPIAVQQCQRLNTTMTKTKQSFWKHFFFHTKCAWSTNVHCLMWEFQKHQSQKDVCGTFSTGASHMKIFKTHFLDQSQTFLPMMTESETQNWAGHWFIVPHPIDVTEQHRPISQAWFEWNSWGDQWLELIDLDQNFTNECKHFCFTFDSWMWLMWVKLHNKLTWQQSPTLQIPRHSETFETILCSTIPIFEKWLFCWLTARSIFCFVPKGCFAKMLEIQCFKSLESSHKAN